MKWLILLEINESDFLNLSKLLTLSEKLKLIEKNSCYYLYSLDFEPLTNVSDVYGRATELFQKLNAVAMIHFPEFQLLNADVIEQVDENRKHHRFIAGSGTIKMDKSKASIKVEGGQDSAQFLELEPWIDLADKDKIVENVFRIWTSFEQNWVNLYKIYEIVNQDAKSKKLEEWVTKNKISNFTHTSQSVNAIGDDARHGVEKQEPPKNPMSLLEAKNLIREILKNWLNWKCQQKK
ncbi:MULTISPECIES: hypothetical protein [Cyanophyceae]|uniref:hypothetical protein n=1 Tax=Cyanophyceae TaxID=3028117 RepID=UPI001683A6F6|nr:hypothetical protein [Trichocoleus sp. FACHB-40]MBD2006432.1 hypothetical protein [Trichocoleus sp. FACHB-40]